MLLRFSVSNHLSLRDSQELLFTTSSLKDKTEGLIGCAAAPRGTILPAVVVFGANASGKSNLVHALRAMQQMVLFSHTRGDASGGVPRHAFKLDASYTNKPSRFEIDFVHEEVRYHYGFEADDTVFLAEWLHAIPRSHRRILFEREGSEFRFGRELKGRSKTNNTIVELTRPNSLFLSTAAQNNHEQMSAIFEYFRSLACFMHINTGREYWRNQKDIDPRVIGFIGGLDTGICDYRRRETEPSEEELSIRREINTLVERRANVSIDLSETYKNVTIELAHQTRRGESVFLDLGLESAGTQRLLVMLNLAYRALDAGSPIAIDELDMSLHTLASAAVLQLFCSPTTNPNGAQLIATTHDTNLLGWPGLRRDQIWFTEKDEAGATLLYPLTDIKTRRTDNLEKGYLQGRYGAVPFDDPISILG